MGSISLSATTTLLAVFNLLEGYVQQGVKLDCIRRNTGLAMFHIEECYTRDRDIPARFDLFTDVQQWAAELLIKLVSYRRKLLLKD